MKRKLSAMGLLMALGASACRPELPVYGEERLSAPEMAVLFGGGRDDGTSGPAQEGKCCYVIAACAESAATSCNGKDPCDGTGLSSIATQYALKCGKTPTGTFDPTWSCANHDSALGNPAICAVQKFCVYDIITNSCKFGTVVPNTEVTGQWLCEQSPTCRTIPVSEQ